MVDLYISTNFNKTRDDEDTGFLIVMGNDLNLSYFNDSARDIVAHLIKNTCCTVRDLFSTIKSMYDVDPLTLQTDIIKFIRDLQWKGLISLSTLPTEQVHTVK
ncbi:PqqD family protein [Plesiomonas shigelloides]|uniref:PqqD family protein n=1 Tax=Plesiomonas shigelloides TaxID=703 RepID=UPI00177C0B83|nr:PqqD family protein [Plesiomonas shigelloides]MDT1012013.1 PqqD family protein [Plesiomonas shigelloides]QOH80124.1 PqqD family protein [Plesiomonas shigelloides]